MQDGAPGHTGGNTKLDLQERGIDSWIGLRIRPIQIQLRRFGIA